VTKVIQLFVKISARGGDHDERKPGFSSLKKFFISALVLKQNRAAACRPKLVEQFLFCFKTNAEVKNFFNEEKPGFISS